MPEEKKPVAETVAETDAAIEAHRRAEVLAKAQAEAEAKPRDETVEGGRYKVGDEFVDAEGKPLKKKSE